MAQVAFFRVVSLSFGFRLAEPSPMERGGTTKAATANDQVIEMIKFTLLLIARVLSGF